MALLKTETNSTEQYFYSAGAPLIIKCTRIGNKSADRKKLKMEIYDITVAHMTSATSKWTYHMLYTADIQ